MPSFLIPTFIIFESTKPISSFLKCLTSSKIVCSSNITFASVSKTKSCFAFSISVLITPIFPVRFSNFTILMHSYSLISCSIIVFDLSVEQSEPTSTSNFVCG